MITVRGQELLRQADCVIYDRLIPPGLLQEAKAGCDLVYAGKEAHHHIMKQKDINARMIREAKRVKKWCVSKAEILLFSEEGERRHLPFWNRGSM